MIDETYRLGANMTNRYDASASRLLILTGSDEVVQGTGRLNALDHFDGASFRIVRKYLADAAPIVAEGLHILVLTSAGFIGAYERVSHDLTGIGDDQNLELSGDKRSAKVLHDAIDGADHVFMMCSATIETSLNSLMVSRPAGRADWLRSEVARGSDARKLNCLLHWLVRTTPATDTKLAMIRSAARAVELATDRLLTPAATAVLDGYLAQIEATRDETRARLALAGL